MQGVAIPIRKKAFGGLFIAILLLAFSMTSKGQQWGGKAGLQIVFGTHQQRIGITGGVYFVRGNAQASVTGDLTYHLKNLGPKKIHPEIQIHTALMGSWGNADSLFQPFRYSANRTGYKNSAGYCYNIYLTPIKTTQVTGTLFTEMEYISFVFENDLLARGYYDRYRTGGLMLGYRSKDFMAGVQNILWTGANGKRINDPAYPFPNGYMDLSASNYGNLSHGILAASFSYWGSAIPSFQKEDQYQVQAGWDAEQIRHAVQNRWVHDMIFLPKVWRNSKNAHIPMLDENGKPYLFGKEQKIKAPRPFLQTSLNAPIFY